MNIDRFKKRRLHLAARHICTRCAHERAKPGCKWCGGCLATEDAKREIKQGPARDARRVVIKQRHELLLRELQSRLSA